MVFPQYIRNVFVCVCVADYFRQTTENLTCSKQLFIANKLMLSFRFVFHISETVTPAQIWVAKSSKTFDTYIISPINRKGTTHKKHKNYPLNVTDLEPCSFRLASSNMFTLSTWLLFFCLKINCRSIDGIIGRL